MMSTVFDTIADLKTALQQTIANAQHEPEAERVSCAMTLSSLTIVPIKFPVEGKNAHPESDDSDSSVCRSVFELCNLTAAKERLRWQRGAARGILFSLQEIDGFKYTFNNNWTSTDEAGWRFSYTCLDSRENKDRQVNNLRKKGDYAEGSRAYLKETYDCKGQIAVKFSGARHVVEVVYKHTAIHKTVAERAPAPRAMWASESFGLAKTSTNRIFINPTNLNCRSMPPM